MAYGLYDSEHHQAKPEVNHEAKIQMRRDVPRRLWKVRHQQKVNSVSRHDGD
jgi:hypothetical protein